MHKLLFRSLLPDDAEILAQLLTEDKEYSRYFVPFENPSVQLFVDILINTRKDTYWGIFVDDILAGFCMLRGFDLGYTKPSFGVYISSNFQGMGLATLALRWCISYCQINLVPTIMLKVHPENHAARHIYEQSGFVFQAVDTNTGHHIMEKRLRVL